MNLKEYINFKGISQEQAAKEIGITRQHLNMIIQNKCLPGKNAALKIEKWSDKLFKAADLMQLN
jgi:DNA-binding XRE family transcriptional regulator